MKHDPAFKLLATIILAGVAVSLFAPATHAAETSAQQKHPRTRTPSDEITKREGLTETRTETFQVPPTPKP